MSLARCPPFPPGLSLLLASIQRPPAIRRGTRTSRNNFIFFKEQLFQFKEQGTLHPRLYNGYPQGKAELFFKNCAMARFPYLALSVISFSLSFCKLVVLSFFNIYSTGLHPSCYIKKIIIIIRRGTLQFWARPLGM